MQAADWQKLWLGGFCAPGIYGSPVKAADARSRPTLAQALTLSSQVGASGRLERNGNVDCHGVVEQWSHYVGGRPVVIASNLESARRQLLQTLDVVSREPVLLPANATHSLVEVVKAQGAKPRFAELDQHLALLNNQHCRVVWLQPPLGLPIQNSTVAEVMVLDHGDSVPRNLSNADSIQRSPDVEIYGLRLAHDPRHPRALLVFADEALYARFLAENEEVEPTVYTRAAEQLQRLTTLVPAQETALDFIRTGLQAAAGLPLLPVSTGSALAHGIAFRVPDEGSHSLFWSYVSRENTPVQWLPEVCPIHYAAISTHAASAANLERWMFVPVAPDDDSGVLKQAVLGVVKTAEYLGLRWRTDPERAAQYAARLDEIYGPEHDAYRPAFPLPAHSDLEELFNLEDFLAQACSIPPL